MSVDISELHLVLGGARSGKSSYAENMATQLYQEKSAQLVYIATATAGDGEMHERIARHQQDRHDAWQLIEEPIELASAISKINTPSVILIDCLTLWLSNCLHASTDVWQDQKSAFIKVLMNVLSENAHQANASQPQQSHHILMVSNEVGHGITPLGELSRRYVDEIGWLHQELASLCNEVTMVIAGLPQKLK